MNWNFWSYHGALYPEHEDGRLDAKPVNTARIVLYGSAVFIGLPVAFAYIMTGPTKLLSWSSTASATAWRATSSTRDT